jgi:hypothetical protein
MVIWVAMEASIMGSMVVTLLLLWSLQRFRLFALAKILFEQIGQVGLRSAW